MNPVFYHPGGRILDRDNPATQTPFEIAGWYFWDETWANYTGPYPDENTANKKAVEYGKQI